MNWYRWWHGSATDPKFQMIASESGIPLSSVLGIWSVILEHASMNDPRGQFKWEPEVLSFHLGVDVVTPCNAMKHRGLLHVTDGMLHINNWEKRQPKREREDDSSDRVRKFRANKKQELTECNANVTPCNANETHVTPRLDKSREEINTVHDEKFIQFWSAYPKKKAKADAEKAWKSARINGEFDSVIEALEAQKRTEQWKKDNGQFIPLPATWIRGKRWLDENEQVSSVRPDMSSAIC